MCISPAINPSTPISVLSSHEGCPNWDGTGWGVLACFDTWWPVLAEGHPDDVLKQPEVIRAYLGSANDGDNREINL
jgi:hypothetical protein